MARQPNERPARRLDAILDSIQRHGIVEFEAGELDGIGKGLRFVFGPTPRQRVGSRPGAVPGAPDADLGTGEAGEPLDELALVAEGREGPVPGNGVS